MQHIDLALDPGCNVVSLPTARPREVLGTAGARLLPPAPPLHPVEPGLTVPRLRHGHLEGARSPLSEGVSPMAKVLPTQTGNLNPIPDGKREQPPYHPHARTHAHAHTLPKGALWLRQQQPCCPDFVRLVNTASRTHCSASVHLGVANGEATEAWLGSIHKRPFTEMGACPGLFLLLADRNVGGGSGSSLITKATQRKPW